MNQEAFAKGLELLKQQLVDEVIVHFQHANKERGDQAFERWKERFIQFLQPHAPGEAERFKRQTHHNILYAVEDEHPYIEFMREDGNTSLAFIDELVASALKGRIINFQEHPSPQTDDDKPKKRRGTTHPYVNPKRIQELQAIASPNYDLSKLIKLCEELNLCFTNECYLAVAMLVRAILDHVPPIFKCNNFGEVANNYGGGGKSFKGSMQHLENSSRNIADAQLHKQIRNKETLPNETQVNFSNDLDVLLEEIVRILK